MDDRSVIKAFIDHLRVIGFPGLKVDCWPEDKNRDTQEIDAIAGPFAIEHTSVDTLPKQRRDSDWFMQAVGSLNAELPSVPFRLRITIEYGAVTKGQNWTAIREALKTWVTNDANRLTDGRHIMENVPAIPFRIHVTKSSDRPPGVFIGRREPHDDTLPDRTRILFDRKAEKLAKYHKSGTTTVLLVENDDIALMNETKMLKAIREAYPVGLPSGVDQVWYADTSIPSEIKFYNFTAELVNKSEN